MNKIINETDLFNDNDLAIYYKLEYAKLKLFKDRDLRKIKKLLYKKYFINSFYIWHPNLEYEISLLKSYIDIKLQREWGNNNE